MFAFSDKGTCIECSLFSAIKVRLSEIEVWLRTTETKSLATVVGQLLVARASRPSIAATLSLAGLRSVIRSVVLDKNPVCEMLNHI